MARNITTRPAPTADTPSIARIYNQGIADRVATFETTPRTPEQIVMQLAERGDRYPTVVVERDGRVIAWAAASLYSARPCYAGIAEFSVYVERAARGSGAGRAAMRALIAACEQRGFWKLIALMFPENAASRALCAGLGFREVGLYRRHARNRIDLDFLAGVGIASTRFNLPATCGIPGCVDFTSSNHFMEDLGVGLRYRAWRRFFVRPELHYYHIDNNQAFHSDSVFRAEVSVGRTWGAK